MIDVLNQSVFALGLISFNMQFALGIYFCTLRKSHFAPAFAFMCFAESAAALATIVFSMSSVWGVYGSMSPIMVVFLRLVIFGGLMASSLFLFIKVRTA